MATAAAAAAAGNKLRLVGLRCQAQASIHQGKKLVVHRAGSSCWSRSGNISQQQGTKVQRQSLRKYSSDSNASTSSSASTSSNASTSSSAASIGKPHEAAGSSWQQYVPPVGVGIALIAFIQFRRNQKKREAQFPSNPKDNLLSDAAVTAIRTFPTRAASRLWGTVNELRLPKFMRKPILGLYSWAFDCRLEDAVVEDLQQYQHLQEFFQRQLKAGIRPVDKDSLLVSPADCRVLHHGQVEGDRIEQIKGIDYSVEELLGTVPPVPAEGNKLYHCVLYLAPGDYHHFHSPAEWVATTRRHFAGDLLSVSKLAARKVRGLFSINERVVLEGHWAHGQFYYVPVGAYNVGSIAIKADPGLETNLSTMNNGDGTVKRLTTALGCPNRFNSYHECSQYCAGRYGTETGVSEGIALQPGDHVGGFRLGSSIVLVFEAPDDFTFQVQPGQKLKYGEALGTSNTPAPGLHASNQTPHSGGGSKQNTWGWANTVLSWVSFG